MDLRFSKFLLDSQKIQAKPVRQGELAGVKVKYAGSTLNGRPSIRTQQWRARDEKCRINAVGSLDLWLKTPASTRPRAREIDPMEDSGDGVVIISSRSHSRSCSHSRSGPDKIATRNTGAQDEAEEQHEGLLPPVDMPQTMATGAESPQAELAQVSVEESDSMSESAHESSESSSEQHFNTTQQVKQHMRTFVPAPDLIAAQVAANALFNILCPPKGKGGGRKHADIDELSRSRFQMMMMLCNLYTSGHQWIAASLELATSVGKGTTYAKNLRSWTQAFIKDHKSLPENNYGAWNISVLHTDEDMMTKIQEHLTGLGQFVSALDVMNFVNTDEIMTQLKLKRPICERTAQRWMQLMGYQWENERKGQYTDGHEREDVVEHRQLVFLPAMAEAESKARKFDKNGDDVGDMSLSRHVIIWFHDESTFYAHDCRHIRWVHNKECPKPYPKGEGQSFMIADFVSADYGWLSSPNGNVSARIELKAGKNRDGYLTCEGILDQATHAMDILEKFYPNDNHILVFDNAMTHSKRADGALSAHKMSKGTSNPDKNWGVQVNQKNPDGSPKHGPDGKILKEWRCMEDARFANGTAQALYYPDNHPTHPGLFKGMAVILEERGYINARTLKAECEKGKTDSCCCRLLYTQPDFTNIPSLLESHCAARGFKVIFLPKYHPELNPIEMCWGYAKRICREKPPSSKIEDLEVNVRDSLARVSVQSIRK